MHDLKFKTNEEIKITKKTTEKNENIVSEEFDTNQGVKIMRRSIDLQGIKSKD